MRSIDDLEVRGRRVLLRSDLNVSLDLTGTGEITDDGRIRASLPVISKLSDRGARVIVMAHLGRQGAEHGVVLEQMRHRGDVTQVVRRHYLDATVAVRGVGRPPEVTADATEPIDSYANCHSTKSPRRSP